MKSRGTVAIAWYRRRDYDRIRAMSNDGDGMEPTYDDWQKMAKSALAVVRSEGLTPHRLIVEPDELAAWLQANNVECNNETRARFALETYRRQHPNE